MIYFKNDCINVYWDEPIKAVCGEWLRYAEGDEYRDGLKAGVDLIAQKGSSRWLADTRNLGPITQEDQNWTTEYLIPKVVKAGMRSTAIVIPRRVIAKMGLNKILSKVGDNEFATSHFDKLEDARKWLGSQK